MKAYLEDALVPVKWAEAQIPILQERLSAWQRSYPYKIVTEPAPYPPDRDLLVAYLEKPLDPLIVGDVGAIINSVRTSLDLMMAAVIARNNVVPNRAPNFPIHKKRNDFLAAVKRLETEYGVSPAEIAYIKRTKAYDGGDHVLWHIGTLDNLRKHQRLLTVEPIPSQTQITHFSWADRLMLHSPSQNRTVLYRIPAGAFCPTKGNTNVGAEIFLNETPAGVGTHPAVVALRAYASRVDALIRDFP